MDLRQQTGRRGEMIARAYLERQGWSIIDTNWRSRIGELDIVAVIPDEPYLVIVEVRTKRNESFGTAAESIDFRKQKKVRRLGLQYAQQARMLHKPLRFDVITVYLPSYNKKPEITHIPAAF